MFGTNDDPIRRGYFGSTHLVTRVAARLQSFGVMSLAVHLVVEHAVRQVNQKLLARYALEAARVKVQLKREIIEIYSRGIRNLSS